MEVLGRITVHSARQHGQKYMQSLDLMRGNELYFPEDDHGIVVSTRADSHVHYVTSFG